MQELPLLQLLALHLLAAYEGASLSPQLAFLFVFEPLLFQLFGKRSDLLQDSSISAQQLWHIALPWLGNGATIQTDISKIPAK